MSFFKTLLAVVGLSFFGCISSFCQSAPFSIEDFVALCNTAQDEIMLFVVDTTAKMNITVVDLELKFRLRQCHPGCQIRVL